MFINSCGSIEDYTRFKTIMAEIYPSFHETKTAENLTVCGTYLNSLQRVLPPGTT